MSLVSEEGNCSKSAFPYKQTQESNLLFLGNNFMSLYSTSLLLLVPVCSVHHNRGYFTFSIRNPVILFSPVSKTIFLHSSEFLQEFRGLNVESGGGGVEKQGSRENLQGRQEANLQTATLQDNFVQKTSKILLN